MSKSARKSILTVNSINLDLLSQHHASLGSQDLSKKLSAALTPSPKMLPRHSLALKMQRLNDMKFTSLLQKDPGILIDFKTKPKPNICITELWGTKESYLRKTSYLEAYKELKKAHQLKSVSKNRSSRKIEKPHVEDFQSKVKVLMNLKNSPDNSCKTLSTIFEVKDRAKKERVSEKIDFIIQKCVEMNKKKKDSHGELGDLRKSINCFYNKRQKLGKKLTGISSSTSELILSDKKG